MKLVPNLAYLYKCNIPIVRTAHLEQKSPVIFCLEPQRHSLLICGSQGILPPLPLSAKVHYHCVLGIDPSSECETLSIWLKDREG